MIEEEPEKAALKQVTFTCVTTNNIPTKDPKETDEFESDDLKLNWGYGK